MKTKKTWKDSYHCRISNPFTWAEQREHTGPWSFNGPLVEEDEFAFAVVNGSLALDLADVCDLAHAVFIFHTDSEKKLVQNFLWPGRDITLRPAMTFINNVNFKSIGTLQ